MESYIKSYIQRSIQAKAFISDNKSADILNFAKTIYASMKNGGKLLIIGNGGSAADAQHIAAELVNRYKIDRSPLPAIALTTDTSVLTSIGNDYSFDQVFSKQVQAIAKKEDVILAISTSGKSPNIIYAMQTARKIGCNVLSLSGKDGGKMMELSDMIIIVPSDETSIIQETHFIIEHLICDLIEKFFIEDSNDR